MKLYLTCGQEPAPDEFTKIVLINNYTQFGKATEISGNHVLDKIPDLISFFFHLNDCLEVGGKATFIQSYFRSPMAWVSPYTVRGISEHSFSWLSKAWREANSWAAPNIDYDFEVQYGLSMDAELETRSEQAKVFSLANYSGSITAVQFVFVKK